MMGDINSLQQQQQQNNNNNHHTPLLRTYTTQPSQKGSPYMSYVIYTNAVHKKRREKKKRSELLLLKQHTLSENLETFLRRTTSTVKCKTFTPIYPYILTHFPNFLVFDKVKSSSNKVFSTTLKQGIFYHKQGKT